MLLGHPVWVHSRDPDVNSLALLEITFHRGGSGRHIDIKGSISKLLRRLSSRAAGNVPECMNRFFRSLTLP